MNRPQRFRVAAFVATLLMLGAIWLFWPEPEDQPHEIAAGVASRSSGTAEQPRRHRDDRSAPTPSAEHRTESRPFATDALPTTAPTDPFGELRLTLVWEIDKSAAVGVPVKIVPWGASNPLFQAAWHVSDHSGMISIPRIRAGTVTCYPLPGGSAGAKVAPGRITDVRIEIKKGSAIEGVVVDENDVRVADADIWLSDYGNDTEGAVAARSNANGEFRIQSVTEAQQHSVGARHARHGPSELVRLAKGSDGAYFARLILRSGAGSLRGLVLGPDGLPCVARILVVPPRSVWSVQRFETMTDSDGSFLVEGLAVGRYTLGARAAVHCPWQGECVITASAEATIKIDLRAGAILRGKVVDWERRPVNDANVHLGEYGDPLDGYSATTGMDGAFIIEGLAPGRSMVRVAKARVGKVRVEIDLAEGEAAECELMLERGLVIKGKVLGPDGSPLVGVYAQCATDKYRKDWDSRPTDQDGRFEYTNRPDAEHRIWVEDPNRSFVMLALLEHVKPSEDDIVIRIGANVLSEASIEGIVLGNDGMPVPSAAVCAQQVGALSAVSHEVDERTGRFKIAKLPPGAYLLHARASGRTTVRLEERVLAAGETWDVGTLVLAAMGGVVVTRVFDEGTSEANVSLRVVRTLDDRNISGLVFKNDVAALRDLDAGTYRFVLRGDGLRLSPETFDVVAGQVARVEVRIRKADD